MWAVWHSSQDGLQVAEALGRKPYGSFERCSPNELWQVDFKGEFPLSGGKLERFHRTLKLELLQGRQFTSLGEVQTHFDAWRAIYNQERPHESLEMEVPMSRYRLSERCFKELNEREGTVRRHQPVG